MTSLAFPYARERRRTSKFMSRSLKPALLASLVSLSYSFQPSLHYHDFITVGGHVLKPHKKSHSVTCRRLQSTRLRMTSLEEGYIESYRPLPTMPSPLFISLAQSQMELLASSIDRIKNMALYLPQENADTGQLEFLPAILFPREERIFIAGDADSGQAPRLPKTLTRLPGFEHASRLLPAYPMVSSDSPGVGKVEEVMCDPITKTSALSVPLFRGVQTVGILLVASKLDTNSPWTKSEKDVIGGAAQSLAMALSLDTDRSMLQRQSETLQTQLSDALHQVKNPIQALRTYTKLLQRMADGGNVQPLRGGSPQLLDLIQHLVVQSDRVVDLMVPVDTIVKSLPIPTKKTPLMLQPYEPPEPSQLTALTPYRDSTLEFTRDTKKEKKIEKRIPTAAPNTTANGKTLEFTRSTKPSTQRETTDTSFLPNIEEELEMGFIMDILGPYLDNFSVLAREKGVELEIQAAPTSDLPGVWLLPKAFVEAITNVLDNAIRYVVLGSAVFPKVVVKIKAIQDGPPVGVHIEISDNGPGIPDEEAETIFERGFRGTRTIILDGSGLGLDISRSMMTRMGGELHLLRTSSKGTTFQFTLYRERQVK